MEGRRTDLALERLDGLGRGEIPGVAWAEWRREPLAVHRVAVLDERGARALGRPQGQYLTAQLDADAPWDSRWMWRAAQALAGLLRPLLPREGLILVAGLGNRSMTCDALGPLTLEQLMVTRHLRQALPREFSRLRPVCAVAPGVLGDTGLETAELLHGVVRQTGPAAVIAVDALAAGRPERLCRAFQLCDTGIAPGSGACNPRKALDRETLGVPVIALGVPTVVEADLPPEGSMLLSPKDIDRQVARCARLLGWAINLALQGRLTMEEMEQFLC